MTLTPFVILVLIALILAVVSFKYPLLPASVILICAALLIGK